MFSRGWSPKRNTPGYVYILRGDNGLYKIGSTNQNVERRSWEISHKTGIKCTVRYVCSAPNMNLNEKTAHKKFADKRVYGEWFDLTDEELSSAMQLLRGMK